MSKIQYDQRQPVMCSTVGLTHGLHNHEVKGSNVIVSTSRPTMPFVYIPEAKNGNRGGAIDSALDS